MSAVLSLVVVFAVSEVGACVVVGFYALGARLLAVAGRVLVVEPAEFTDAITVITPEAAATAQKRPRKRAARTFGALVRSAPRSREPTRVSWSVVSGSAMACI